MSNYFKDMRATIEIELNKSNEELWNGLDKDARWGVNKAKKEGLNVEILDEDSKWDELYEIYKETIIRGGIVPKEKEELKSETDKLFSCSKDGKIIAGAAIKIKDKTTELFLNASLRDYLKFQPNNLLYWEIIEWSKKNNYKIFDLGGYQLNTQKGDKLYEVNRFKERWGGEIKKYEVSSKNPFYILGRKVIRNVHFVKKTRDKLKLTLYNRKNSKRKIGFFTKVFRKLIYNKREMIIFLIDLNNIQKIKPRIEVQYKKVNLEELESISKGSYPIYSKFKKRIEKGNECFFYFDEKISTHSSWICYKVMDILEISKTIEMQNNEACIFDCYTAEGYRGKNLYPAMLTELQDYLEKKGFKKCFIYAEPTNEPSINGIKKAGFKEDKLIKYKNIFGIKRVQILNIG